MTSSSSGRFVARRQAITPSLFISYRRHDSAGYSGRVHDRLQREFGHNLLFMDVDSIPLGTNFIKVLGEEIAKCDALLAVIGPGCSMRVTRTAIGAWETPTTSCASRLGPR
jgi:TIR domain